MLDLDFLKSIAVKNQTSDINIIQEYCQHLFLNYFYSESSGRQFLFKGGTALRIVFQSPRYSVDLDFSSMGIDAIEDLLQEVLIKLDREGMKIDNIPESKPTSQGKGYFSLLNFTLPFNYYNPTIKLNVWVSDKPLTAASTIIHNEFVPPYPLFYLQDRDLINEKISAFYEREKPRDYFDLYFILKSDYLRALIQLGNNTKDRIISNLDALPEEELKKELKQFLPINYQNIFLHGGLKEQIRQTINRYL